MSRRAILIVLGVAVLALGGFLLAVDPSREAEGNASIIDFELAFSEGRSDDIRAEWLEQGTAAPVLE